MSSSVSEARSSVREFHRVASRGTPRVVSDSASTRPIRIGLLGLGHVGRAVASLAQRREPRTGGIRFRVAGALVRDVEQARARHRSIRVTDSPADFLRGRYDVVIEALGGLEPARTLVARLLGCGVPVVTANKALIAEAGADLQALAAARGTSLRYEASTIAGVPFLGTLAARPFVSSVERFVAILNGTSNFIISKLAEAGDFDDALAAARRRGLTESDPARDLDGDDAADKLAVLAALLGWGGVERRSLEVTSLRGLTGGDVRAAAAAGGALKPIAAARRTASGLEAFVGPAWVSARSPLGTLDGTLNGIALHGRHVNDLCFTGPGAGPDVTAATLLDDAVESFRTALPAPPLAALPRQTPLPWRTPVTPWFVRIAFPGIVPAADRTAELLSRVGLTAQHVGDQLGHARYARVAPVERGCLHAALHGLEQCHRLHTAAYRCVE